MSGACFTTRLKMAFLGLFLIIGHSLFSFAHEKHSHPPTQLKDQTAGNKLSNSDQTIRLEQVKTLYDKTAKGVFQKSCFACHGQMQTSQFPWYYKVPGVKQLIDHDVTEAKKHLDITQGFPFKGHGTPISDLEAIEESIRKKSMPPWRYRIMHGDAALSEDDRAAVLDWIAKSKELLK